MNASEISEMFGYGYEDGQSDRLAGKPIANVTPDLDGDDYCAGYLAGFAGIEID